MDIRLGEAERVFLVQGIESNFRTDGRRYRTKILCNYHGDL